MKYQRPEPPTWVDHEEKEYFDSKEKKRRKILLKTLLFAFTVIAIVIWAVLHLMGTAACASTLGGFYERGICNKNDRCCFQEPYHNPNVAWQN